MGHYVSGSWTPGALFLPPLASVNAGHDPNLYGILAGDGHFVDFRETDDSKQMGPVGSSFSFGGDAFWHTFYMSPQAARDVRMFPRVRRQDAIDFDEGPVTQFVGAPTLRSGHMGVFDQNSGLVVHAWRNERAEIVLAVSDPTGDEIFAARPLELEGDRVRAHYAPSVACGDPSIPFNCVMVWAHAPEVGQHYSTMRIAQFRVEPPLLLPSIVFDDAGTREVGYVQFGPPAVVYKGPADAEDAFIVAWKYPGGCFSTSRKGPGVMDGLGDGDEVVHCNDFACGSPSLPSCVQLGPPGLLADDGQSLVEVWAVGNDFFTFPN